MLVSIIIPFHNGGPWFRTAVESALNQSYEHCEIILVNDSSSDNSLEIANSFGNRVKLLHGNWCNGNSARNCGLKIAQGTWVQFLDADDFLPRDKIADQIVAARDSVDVVVSPIIERKHGPDSSFLDAVRGQSNELNLFVSWLRWELCQTGAALWRTETLKAIGGWKEGLLCCQDNELVLRALMNGLSFRYVDKPGAVYRIWSEETVCRKDPRRVILQKTELVDYCLDWLEKSKESIDLYREIGGQACFEMARSLAKVNIEEAVEYYKQRQKLGLVNVAGAAAPTMYRLVYRYLGFQSAERIAVLLR